MSPQADTDFMDDIEEARRLQSGVLPNALLVTVSALVVFFFIWASYAEVEKVTRGEGQVVPSRETQIVQSPVSGRLQKLHVREGDIVRKGQLLMEIADVRATSEERGTMAKLGSLKAQRARLTAEVSGEDLNMPEDIQDNYPAIARNEIELYESRTNEVEQALSGLDSEIQKVQSQLAEIDARINKLTGNASYLRQELEITSTMVEQRAAPKIEEIRLRRQLNDTTGNIKAAREQKQALQAEYESLQKRKAEKRSAFQSQALADLNKVETEIAGLEENLVSITDLVRQAELRSPVDGIVNKITLKTEGAGFVEAGKQAVEIVPLDDDLKIIAKVVPDDIAFLKSGQPVNVKITAYDPQKYGALEATLERISANSVSDGEGNIFFEVEVRTRKNFVGDEDNPLPITPGMVAQVEVVTGKRTILEYLAKPFLRARDNAFTEI